MEFKSKIVQSLKIGDSSIYVETVERHKEVDCIFKICLNLNETFKDIQMPHARSNEISSINQKYYEFPEGASYLLRSRFLVNLEPKNAWHLRTSQNYVSTHQGNYLEQVKKQLTHLFSNMDVTVATGTYNTGSGLVKLKDSTCIEFITNYQKSNTLASHTFTKDQLLELCEASSRDASRYSVAEDGTHRLCLKPGDSWSVRVFVSVKSPVSNIYMNSQLWEVFLVHSETV